jgi:phage gp29-like protein
MPAILGQTATTEGTPGKLGNEDAQDRVRRDLTKADCQAIEKTVRFQMVRPLVGYNFGWDKPLPWFKIMFEPAEDLEKLSTVYKNLREMGQPMSAEHVSDRFKIPLPQKGETPLGDVKPEPPGKKTPLAAKNKPVSSERPGMRVVIAKTGEIATEGEIDDADLISERLAEESMPITDERFMHQIRRLLDNPNVRDLADLRDRIIDLWGEMDPEDLGVLIARAMAVAEMAGMAEVQDETGV